MTDQDNLRDRIEQIIEDKTYAMAPDGFIAGTEEAAQAIIDELELTTETHAATHAKRNMTRIVGAWEWNNQ